ncbi:MAG: HAD-IC family P-type ATPase [Gammaproteobacteria bacterium]|nr:HAD-IC family P-type ATPase [Gammaproteobacteria bacterium]
MENTAAESHQGITSSEAAVRLLESGPNELPERKPPGLPRIFLSQFKSPFIYVLFAAAVVSWALGQTINSFFIFVVLLINALIGTIQEYSAERAAAALRKMVPFRATVVRDGKAMIINTADIVCGDYVLLASGDRVPADIRMSAAQDLLVDESMLTGESMATVKDDSVRMPDDAPLGDRSDVCFAGTVIMSGRGAGAVFATGAITEIGKIAADFGADDEVKPPLLQRVEQFTLRITYGILIMVALIFLITVMRGDDLAAVFMLGVALAVSAIPEGLPAAMTVALAIGMRRMAHHSVIIRRLLAVESLGSCTYIASDKTGTLTVNEMTVRRIVLQDGSAFDISGEGLDLHGQVTPQPASGHKQRLDLLCHAGLLANEAELERGEDGWSGQGDGVDVALLVLARKFGLQYERERRVCQQLGSIPYESANAYSASVNRYAGGYEIFLKGSVERLLAMCSCAHGEDASAFQRIGEQANALAKSGYRVLALAHRRVEIVPAELDEFLNDLEFIGMVAMIDPLRPEAITAVQDCKDARIKVAMITGDHPQTARALALQLGLADESMEPVTGSQIRQATASGPAAMRQLINSTRVFARIEPHQKKQIVEQLIEEGEFVAVTGDGVNDAPALSQAHVGIAMGMRGTDVARESADIIITDDNFSSIVEGIKQGRIVYSNIRKVIFLLISTGAAEIALILFSLMFGLPLPLFPLQLLWLNLVTNGVQHIALVMEPEEGHELKRPPRAPNEPIFNRLMIERVLLNAVVMGCLAFAVFSWQLNNGVPEPAARNMTLLLMVLFENVHVLNSRSETLSVFRQGVFSNRFLVVAIFCAQAIHIGAMYTPGLREILQLEPVTLHQWMQLLVVALLLIVVDELHKYWRSRQAGVQAGSAA